MIRWLCQLAAIFVLAVSANAKAEISGEILEYGYYRQVGELKRERNYSTATGYVQKGAEVLLVEQTREIPAVLGRLFGFKFRIRGFPRDEVAVNMKLVVTHPEIVRPNGTRVSGYDYEVAMDLAGGKVENQTGYKFDKEYEMVEGEWKFQYWLNEQLILEQSFNVFN